VRGDCGKTSISKVRPSGSLLGVLLGPTIQGSHWRVIAKMESEVSMRPSDVAMGGHYSPLRRGTVSEKIST
jgi:hypothetical protein